MNRQEKQGVISELKTQFKETKSSFLVNYQGLSVKELQEFRRNVSASGGHMQVAKVRLIKRAVNDIPQSEIQSFCRGQLGIVFSEKESYEMAKVLHDFSKKYANLKLVVGYSDKQLIDKAMIARIAQLPSREAVLSLIAGTIKEMVAKTARLIRALKEKREKEGI